MSVRKIKSAPKKFISDKRKIEEIVTRTMDRVASVVCSTLGPGGRVVVLESDLPNLPNRITKDGVSVFKELGSYDAYEQLVIEIARSAAISTGNMAGDGTTTATCLSASMVSNLFAFCRENPKFSPQKAMRIINECVKQKLLPEIKGRAIKVTQDNQELLEKVATVSANGDREMAKAVISAFEQVGFGDASHVTIQELSGPQGYEVELIEGYPIPMGYEESAGKFHSAFINDNGNLRCVLENPLFLLIDGAVLDFPVIAPIMCKLYDAFKTGESDYKNVVLIAHGFSELVLTQLAFSFADPLSLNILPVKTPMNQMINSQQHFLRDISAFTGAKIFDMNNSTNDAEIKDLGTGMTLFEAYRFRSNLLGNPDAGLIEFRADELKEMLKNPESSVEKIILEERLGKLTNGIAKLKIFGGSSGELREKHDRVEDAICAVRNSITYGCLPGGCRILIDLAKKLADNKNMPAGTFTKAEAKDVVSKVLEPTLLAPVEKLLDNAGYSTEEISEIVGRLFLNDEVYDVETATFTKTEETSIFDSFGAVYEALVSSVSIASVLGTTSGIVCFPRDDEMERSDAANAREFQNCLDNPTSYVNEANNRA
jgi:chaperonin GroEL